MVRPKKSLAVVRNFATEARRVLWAHDNGRPAGTMYRQWLQRVMFLESANGGRLTRQQAIIVASKEFPCLATLFRRFSVEEYDPAPHVSCAGTGGDFEAEAAPILDPVLDDDLIPGEKPMDTRRFTSEGVPEQPQPKRDREHSELLGIDLSYIENIRWAAASAGEFMRTGRSPKQCPNNTAWLLYKLAIEDHRDFLAKLTTAETKVREIEARQIQDETNKTNDGQRSLDDMYRLLQQLQATPETPASA
jgi:hypothetical protein